MKLNKLALSAPLLLTICSAQAFEPGGYIGARMGIEAITSDSTLSGANFNSAGHDSHVHGVFMGYRAPLFEDFAIGVEVEARGQDFQLSANDNQSNYLASIERSYALNTVLTYRFAPTVNFITRVGLAFANLERSCDSAEFAPSENTVRGAMGGVGIELLNQSNMVFRMEYRYTGYQSIALYDYSDTTMKLKSHDFSIGAYYRF